LKKLSGDRDIPPSFFVLVGGTPISGKVGYIGDRGSNIPTNSNKACLIGDRVLDRYRSSGEALLTGAGSPVFARILQPEQAQKTTAHKSGGIKELFFTLEE